MKDILSPEQIRDMVKAAIPLVQSSETSFHADLACHVCALADTAETLRAEVERLREALTKVANGAKYLIEDADLLDRTKTIRAIVKIARAVLDAGQDQ